MIRRIPAQRIVVTVEEYRRQAVALGLVIALSLLLAVAAVAADLTGWFLP